MRALFLADAHLRHPNDENYRRLLEFLSRQQGNLDGLFLLGDIFEFWIGYRHVVFADHLPLLCCLQQLKDHGCKLYYVEGNHDFNLGDYFAKTLDCTIIPDQQVIEWNGQRLFVCHGDLANPRDFGYRLMRRFWRSALLRGLSKIISPDAAWRFGNFLCDLSRKKERQPRDPSHLVVPYANKALAEADHFICGHFHYPIQTETTDGRITVLGDWITQYSYLEIIGDKAELRSYASPSA